MLLLLLLLLQLAVDTLEDESVASFVMEGEEKVGRLELLQLAALQYSCQPQEYCMRLRMQTTWGGGPEILALSHALRRPIAVYTLQRSTQQPHQLRRTPAALVSLQQHRRRQQALLNLLQQPQPQQQQQQQQQQLQREQESLLRLCKVFGWREGCEEEPLHLLFINAAGLSGGPLDGNENHFVPLFPAAT